MSPPPPPPPARRGPRPLLLHLMLARMRSSASMPGWPAWNPASPPWNALFAQAAAAPDPTAFLPPPPEPEARLLRGIVAYRAHPSHRDLPEAPVAWQDGNCRLLDYGGAGAPVLFVPSLINRYYILDLAQDRSLLRHVAAAGWRTLVLDWGWPDPITRDFSLTDYVCGPLERALIAIGQPVALVGYCLGGLLALAAALRRPDLVRGLGLLATPWQFRAPDPTQADRLAAAGLMLEPILAGSGTLPIDLLQALFALLDPDQVAAKYRRFATLDPSSDAAALFVAIEDWANDCVPLAAPVARECLIDWYGRNTPDAGAWRIAGQPILPENLRVPSFVALPGQDRIVPPESARPLAARLPGAEVREIAGGHVSLVIGKSGAATLWPALIAWLATLTRPAQPPPPRRRAEASPESRQSPPKRR